MEEQLRRPGHRKVSSKKLPADGVLLAYLQCHTNNQAAEKFGVARSTVRSRRALLTRRGHDLSGLQSGYAFHARMGDRIVKPDTLQSLLKLHIRPAQGKRETRGYLSLQEFATGAGMSRATLSGVYNGTVGHVTDDNLEKAFELVNFLEDQKGRGMTRQQIVALYLSTPRKGRPRNGIRRVRVQATAAKSRS